MPSAPASRYPFVHSSNASAMILTPAATASGASLLYFIRTSSPKVIDAALKGPNIVWKIKTSLPASFLIPLMISAIFANSSESVPFTWIWYQSSAQVIFPEIGYG